MASPQIENGYTRIANEIVDQFSKIRLSGNEWSILWVIMRKTYGWNKKEDNISLTQLSKETGLSRPTVVRNRDKLVRYGVLGISNATSKNKNGAKYWIKKDYENWNTGIRKDTSSNFATSTSSKSRKKLVAPTQHTKDNIQKTNKDRGASAKRCLSYFGKSFLKETGNKYHATFKKETSIFKNLLNTHTEERIFSLIDSFFKSEDEFVQKSGKTVGVFYSQINKLTLEQSKPGRLM